MPYPNVPDDKQDLMKKCVTEVMAQGKDESAAIAICYASIVEGKNVLDETPKAYAPIYSPVQIKSIDAQKAVVAGYGVIFGGRDLTGDQFTKSTDYFLGYVPHPAVFYDHTMREVKNALGAVISIKADDKGLWVEAELDRSKDYVEEVLKLIKKGVLGWSSGSIAHLVRREKNVIKSWAIAEFSLTPTPAEPRTLGVSQIKTDATTETAEGLSAESATRGGDMSINQTIKQEQIMEAKTDFNITGGTISLEAIEAMAEKAIAKREAEAKAKLDREAEIKAAEERGAQKAREEIKAAKSGGYSAPNVLKTAKLGSDDGWHELKHYLLTGQSATKASNDTDMNVGTSADGGYTVQTTVANQIAARRDEIALHAKLGLRLIPGVGTTVNVPLDSEADGEFVSTSEASNFDRDAPAMGQKAFTLVKYTKKIQLSYELLQDTETNLEQFLTDWVARGMAKTMNDLLITEVETNGTSLKTFASATALAAGEIDAMVFNQDLAHYLDDSASVAWVMNPATFGALYVLSGNNRIYAEQVQGNGAGMGNKMLLGYPVHYSNKADAYAASKKSVFFGNWNEVGYRLSPDIQLLRDPYSAAGSGQINLFYYFRTVFGVLQPEAIGYGVHPSA